MNWFGLSGLLTGLACTAMSVWIYRKNPSAQLNTLWAIFCISVAIWGFGALAIGSVNNPSHALVSWRLSYTGVVCIPSLFYHFVCHFLGLKRTHSIRAGYALSVAFLVAIWFPTFFPTTKWVFGQFYYAQPGPCFYLFALFFAGYVLWSHVDLWTYLRRYPGDPRRTQVIWFFAATSLGYLGGSTSFLPIFGLEWYPWGNMTVPLYPVIMTYAIFRHQLMDIRVVVKRTVYYTFFAVGLSLFYVGIVYAVHLIMTGEIFRVAPFVSGEGFSPYSVLPICGAVSFMGLGLFVLARRGQDRAALLFGVLCLQVCVWQVVWLLSFYLPERRAGTLVRLAYVAISFIPVVYLHFILTHLQTRALRGTLRAAYMVTCVLVLLLRSDLYVAGYRRYEWGYYTLPGPLFPVFVVLSLTCMSAGCYVMGRRSSDKDLSVEQRRRLQYLLLSFTVFMCCAIDFLQVYGHTAYPIGTIFFLASFAITTYAIVKHELLDIRVTLQRTVIYTLMTIMVSGLYLALVYVFYTIAPAQEGRGALITGFVGVLFVAAVFKPIEIAMNRALERRFFKGTIGEISELNKQLETELERRERLKSVGILAAGMAHEIKNPLTVIQTFAEHLPAKYADAEFREKFQRLVTAEVGRMRRIVEDLLTFSRPKDPVRRPVDLDRILGDLLLLIGPQAARQHVHIDQSLEPASATVDADQLKQALLNILMNAIESMPQGGGLVVRSGVRDGRATVTISDGGCGIPEEQLGHIFDPFYSNKDGGTGLGLAITHTIITKNGGEVHVASTVGHGTVFDVSFPPC